MLGFNIKEHGIKFESENGKLYKHYISMRSKIGDFKLKNEPYYCADEILHRYKFMNIWRDLDHNTLLEAKHVEGMPLNSAVSFILLNRYFVNFDVAKIVWDGFTKSKSNGQIYRYLREAIPLVRNYGSQDARLVIFGDAIEEDTDFETAMYIARVLYNSSRHLLEYLDTLPIVDNTTEDNTVSMVRLFLKKHINKGLVGDISNTDEVARLNIFKVYEMLTSLRTLFLKTNALYQGHVLNNEVFYIGHGSVKGVRLLTGILDSKISSITRHDFSLLVEQFNVENRREEFLTNSKKFTFGIRELEDSFCEFRKYYNLKNNVDGQRKRFYKGYDYGTV